MSGDSCETPFDFDDVALGLRLVEACGNNLDRIRKHLKEWAKKHRNEGVAADFELNMIDGTDKLFKRCYSRALPLCVVADAIAAGGDDALAKQVRACCAACAKRHAPTRTQSPSLPTLAPVMRAGPPRCWAPRPELDALCSEAAARGLDERAVPFLAVLCSGDGVPGGTGKVCVFAVCMRRASRSACFVFRCFGFG